MAIVRSGMRVNRAITHSSSSTDSELQKRRRQRCGKRQRFFVESEDFDESEVSEKDAVEICQVGEDFCAVPCELLELADLKGILSLDTWNFCLTEEDREKLSAYLPNLGEESYKRTLKDLFAVENFHFGSPLTLLLDRLKGGLCNPQVLRYREGLKYLRRKEYCHHLRRYHNTMVNAFLEMRNFWQNFPEADFEERIKLWKLWKVDKTKLLSQLTKKKVAHLKELPLHQSARRAALVKLREALESPQLPPGRLTMYTEDVEVLHLSLGGAAVPETESEKVLKVKSASGSKGGVKHRLQSFNGKESEAVQRLLRNELLKKCVNPEVDKLDPKIFFNKEGPAAIHAVSSTSEHKVLAMGKLNLMKSEKKGAGKGAGRKRKRIKEVGEYGTNKIEEESTIMKELHVKCPLMIMPMVIEGRKIKDEQFQEKLEQVHEPVQQEPVSLEEGKRYEEPKKKCRRKAKVNERCTGEDGQAGDVAKLEQNREE